MNTTTSRLYLSPAMPRRPPTTLAELFAGAEHAPETAETDAARQFGFGRALVEA